MRRAGFTLLEVLVGVLIFSIVSVAMIGVLIGAVRIFRGGESARAAHDDAVAVLAQLDEDIARMVPQGDGGFFYLRVRDDDVTVPGFLPDQLKSMVLAFKIRNPDAQAATTDASAVTPDTTSIRSRLIVTWWVDDDGWLNRVAAPATEWQQDPLNRQREITQVAAALGGAGNHLSANCLYFGADLSLDQELPAAAQAPGDAGLSVRPDLAWNGCLPVGTNKYCTEPSASNPDVFQPFPRAIRIAVTLTGGSRNQLLGTIVRDTSSGIRITGVGQVPLGMNALARIGDATSGTVEWIRYDLATGGVLTLAGGRPEPVRRTVQATHNPGEPIVFGKTYSMVRSLPR